jgi:hypothetical protein
MRSEVEKALEGRPVSLIEHPQTVLEVPEYESGAGRQRQKNVG